MAAPIFNILLFLTLFTGLLEKFNTIRSINRLKSDAEYNFKKGNYERAAECYDSLITYYEIIDEKIHLNLAHSYFKNEDKKRAAIHYNLLTKSTNIEISSIAYQQLGIMSSMKGKMDDAISNYKKSLIINPSNEIARYNLELVKKLKELEMQGNSKASSNKGKGDSKGGNQNKGNKSVEGTTNKVSDYGKTQGTKGQQEEGGDITDESDTGKENKNSQNNKRGDEDNASELKQDQAGNKDNQALRAKRLNEMNISQEKARLLLEEMKNEEIQYFQQLKKQTNTKGYTGKPEW